MGSDGVQSHSDLSLHLNLMHAGRSIVTPQYLCMTQTHRKEELLSSIRVSPLSLDKRKAR